jgi:hypothetical protein
MLVMFMAHGRPQGVYRRGWAAWPISGGFVVMGLVYGAGLSDPQFGWRVFGVVMAAICFACAYAIWRAATVAFYAAGALVGTALGPRWIPWDQMIDISLQPDRSGYGRRGHVPVIHLKSGGSLRLGLFFVPEGRSSERDIAERVANALRAHVGPAS